MPDSLEPPTGISRWFARAPIWLYRHRLGWLLGKRFLLLNHIGRKTGLTREAVVEIVRHDMGSGAFIICSGWGEHSQWFQNVMADPDTTIQVGNRTIPVHAVRLAPTDGAGEMVDYSRRHPRAARRIVEFVGGDLASPSPSPSPSDTAADPSASRSKDRSSRTAGEPLGSEASYRAIGERLPFLRLDPR